MMFLLTAPEEGLKLVIEKVSTGFDVTYGEFYYKLIKVISCKTNYAIGQHVAPITGDILEPLSDPSALLKEIL